MQVIRKQDLVAAAIVGALSLTGAYAQTSTPGFNQKIPERLGEPELMK